MNHASEMKAVVKAELTFDRRDQLIDTAVWKQEETRSATQSDQAASTKLISRSTARWPTTSIVR